MKPVVVQFKNIAKIFTTNVKVTIMSDRVHWVNISNSITLPVSVSNRLLRPGDLRRTIRNRSTGDWFNLTIGRGLGGAFGDVDLMFRQFNV